MTDLSPILAKADDTLPQSLDRLFDLVRIPSISTDPAYKAECRKAGEWLVKELAELGFDTSLRDTPGHPMVVAHHAADRADAPHVLFYGHYDVQPVDPLDLWEDDPFAPAIKEKDGRKIITGRGTSDDKGQLLTFVEACRAYKTVKGSLPVRITILFEGEEEIRFALAEALPRSQCGGVEGRFCPGLRHQHVGPRDPSHCRCAAGPGR